MKFAKILPLTVAAALAVAAPAFASGNAFGFTGVQKTGSTVELAMVSTPVAGTITVYDYHGGVQGDVLGVEKVHAGANPDVSINLGRDADGHVIAVLTNASGSVVDEQVVKFVD